MDTEGARLPIVADRQTPLVLTIYYEGVDLTGCVMRAQVRLYRDAPGDPLVDLPTVTTTNTEGLRLVSVETDALGLPTSKVSMRINQSTMQGLPIGDIDTDVELAWDQHITIEGDKGRRLYGPFIVRPGVTR
jgi:hypothetical protein